MLAFEEGGLRIWVNEDAVRAYHGDVLAYFWLLLATRTDRRAWPTVLCPVLKHKLQDGPKSTLFVCTVQGKGHGCVLRAACCMIVMVIDNAGTTLVDDGVMVLWMVGGTLKVLDCTLSLC